jgi:hypothetical protein
MKTINYLMIPTALILLELSLAGCTESGQNEDTRQYRDGMEMENAQPDRDRPVDQNDTLGNSNESENPHLVE